jgi:hypothetical protein
MEHIKVRFEVLTAMLLKIQVLMDICCAVEQTVPDILKEFNSFIISVGQSLSILKCLL